MPVELWCLTWTVIAGARDLKRASSHIRVESSVLAEKVRTTSQFSVGMAGIRILLETTNLFAPIDLLPRSLYADE